ncbi:MAG: tRNA nucleotidyltransferase [Anaerolineales bacterium]|nr:MAG: tRNA nucleotidyltransferase [Anaerolineales bacterium]
MESFDRFVMQPPSMPEMSAQAALQLVKLFDEQHIAVILDGGWGVDALLGEQTRRHADLDIVIAYDDVIRLRSLLEGKGYADVPRPDTRPVNFVMGDAQGHEVDIHTYSKDRLNHPEQGLDYPLESFYGEGRILDYPVRCIDAISMVQFHTGYELDDNDYRDVKALCLRFGIQMPAEYNRFEQPQPDE